MASRPAIVGVSNKYCPNPARLQAKCGYQSQSQGQYWVEIKPQAEDMEHPANMQLLRERALALGNTTFARTASLTRPVECHHNVVALKSGVTCGNFVGSKGP